MFTLLTRNDFIHSDFRIVVRTDGVLCLRPEKSWRPIVSLSLVETGHTHETTLGCDGQNPNMKNPLVLYASSICISRRVSPPADKTLTTKLTWTSKFGTSPPQRSKGGNGISSLLRTWFLASYSRGKADRTQVCYSSRASCMRPEHRRHRRRLEPQMSTASKAEPSTSQFAPGEYGDVDCKDPCPSA